MNTAPIRNYNPANFFNPSCGRVAVSNVLRYRAQSILHGFVDDPLPDTEDQARDVIDWAQRITTTKGTTT